ncbi:MAG TPA: hypothetical protein VJA18_05865 [Candidatus Nanoarchaeia archaeon]|nr:hypothetical protein [Candidatus Nanoarchaeia archaeon]
MSTNLKKVFDLPLPSNLYDRISEVEILLETLNWINREKQRRLVLAQVNLISLELKRHESAGSVSPRLKRRGLQRDAF